MGTEAKVVLSAEDRFSRVFKTLRGDLKGAGQDLRSLTSITSAVTSSLGPLGIAAASVGAGFLALQKVAQGLDALNDAKVIVGDTVENLSALEDVARRNGGDLDLVTTALVKMNKALSDAEPDSNAAKALRAIGLDAAKLRAEAPTQALQEIAAALNTFADDGNKARLVQELFGKSLKEIAPLLRDITESGKLNATVTEEQVRAAKVFNDNIFELQTNLGNLARTAAGPFIEAFNAVNATLGDTGLVVKQLDGAAAAVAVPLEAMAVLGANVKFVLTGIGTELGGIAAQAAALSRGDFRAFGAIGAAMKEDAAAARKEIDALSDRILRVGAISADTLAGFRKTAASFGGGKLPSVGDQTGKDDPAKAARAQVSEAQRYLETLQKQGEKLQDLTTLQQALRDIEAKRIGGLTPALAEQIKKEAERVDLQKDINEGKEREVAMQKLLAELTDKEVKALEDKQAALDKLFGDIAAQSRNDAISLIKDTDVGRLQAAQVQIENLRALLQDPAFQDADSANAVIEAIERIKDSMAGLGEKGRTEFEMLADTIDKTMERSTDAIIDFVVDGQAATSNLWKSFSRDILRQLIEDPVRDVMKGVAATIKGTFADIKAGGGGFGSAGGGSDFFGDFFKNLVGNLLSNIGGEGFGGTWTGQHANGGRVRAGSVLRVNENGTETFVPDRDGVILSNSQTRARAAGGPAVNITNVFNVGGSTDERTVALLEGMINRNNAKLQRSMRTGGAWSTA